MKTPKEMFKRNGKYVDIRIPHPTLGLYPEMQIRMEYPPPHALAATRRAFAYGIQFNFLVFFRKDSSVNSGFRSFFTTETKLKKYYSSFNKQ